MLTRKTNLFGGGEEGERVDHIKATGVNRDGNGEKEAIRFKDFWEKK